MLHNDSVGLAYSRMLDLSQVTESLMEYQMINHVERFPVWNMNMLIPVSGVHLNPGGI
ncbi:unnamed protein product [Rhizopus stolonifer]